MPKILIADDDRDIADLLAHRCRAMGLEVEVAHDALAALDKARRFAPDVAILDVDMPPGDGLCTCEMMSKHCELQEVPVIILTAFESEDVVRRCHWLYAYYVLKCPNVWTRIEPLLQELVELTPTSASSERTWGSAARSCSDLRRQATDLAESVFAILGAEEGTLDDDVERLASSGDERPWVLCVEDDDDVALALRLRLEEFGLQVVRAAAGAEGYRRAFLQAPRAIILDYELPQGNGDYVLRRLKENPATASIPVVVLTGRKEASIERKMRALGASEFLTKPFQWSKLRAALEPRLLASVVTDDG